MTLIELVEQCERGLRQTYSVRLAHVYTQRRPGVAIAGWTWHVDVDITDGGIVHAAHTMQGPCIREASLELTRWLANFG